MNHSISNRRPKVTATRAAKAQKNRLALTFSVIYTVSYSKTTNRSTTQRLRRHQRYQLQPSRLQFSQLHHQQRPRRPLDRINEKMKQVLFHQHKSRTIRFHWNWLQFWTIRKKIAQQRRKQSNEKTTKLSIQPMNRCSKTPNCRRRRRFQQLSRTKLRISPLCVTFCWPHWTIARRTMLTISIYQNHHCLWSDPSIPFRPHSSATAILLQYSRQPIQSNRSIRSNRIQYDRNSI